MVRFSEPVIKSPIRPENVRIDGTEVLSVVSADMLFRKFIIEPAVPLIKGKTYELKVSDDVRDFAGNGIQKKNFVFGLTEPPEKGDIQFNELLFNPWPGDPDYIEFYNVSGRYIDASRLQIVSVSEVTGEKSSLLPLSDESRCLLPESYYAVTIVKDKITERYFSSDPDNIFEIASLPSMPDDKGHLILYNAELQVVDEVKYTEDMHYSLLSSFEGVALEKITPSLVSYEPDSWHSASESMGWGTPGMPNSVFTEMEARSDQVSLSSSKITPDNDGNEDFLLITLNLKGNGNVISATVFDETGILVKKIVTNMLAGSAATLTWDGTSADGTIVNTGIYIIFISLFDDTGKSEKWKKVCTVIRN